MSHFTVLVVLPKAGLQKLNGKEFEGKEEWQNAYDHQWYHPQLEQALEPYNECPPNESDYVERVLEYNETASKIYSSYLSKQWDLLAQEFAVVKDQQEQHHRIAQIHDKEAEGGFRRYTEDEIAVKLEPFTELYGLMATEDFDLYNNDHCELFKSLFSYSDEIVWNDKGDVEDVLYSNPYAKWDWWVVGGRWRSMGDNGLFKDLNVFLETKEIPYWKEELSFKLYDIERELGIDRKDLSQEEYDEYINDYIVSGNKIVRFYDTETKEPKEYYDKKDLLTMVTRKKESTWAVLFPEEGWLEAGEMGWFGMSSLDSMDLQETEQAKGDQYALTDNLIQKYADTHIGLVVDCHI
jgi:hypothetical protein